MRLVFFGLSLSSSWGNGHATTYRSLLRGLAGLGHDILFLEREQPWYSANQDLTDPDFCELQFYDSLKELHQWRSPLAKADAVIIGSFVPDAIAIIEWLNSIRRGRLGFYDIDTPVTLRMLAHGDTEYLSPGVMPLFDIYLSFTGGPVLKKLERRYGVQRACKLYCSVDPGLYQPTGAALRWDLGYLGTYSPDRQERLKHLLIDVAVRLPDKRFVVAGAQYPPGIEWPANVERIEHLGPNQHAEFYSSLGWALNVTRMDMVRTGYSPSVRLFEATACGAPVITDRWAGLEDVFTPGSDLLTAACTDDVVAALAFPRMLRNRIGAAGRSRTLAKHTGERRAEELVVLLTEPARGRLQRSA
jgi:spore maturation protein CgeB